MPNVFGPVPSRRLGRSLGIDLIPHKTCTYDCLYCQVGRTTCKTIVAQPYVSVRAVAEELREKLAKDAADTITLAGSGEPTLHSEIHEVIEIVKGLTRTRVALLTNGSLLWKEDVRKRVLRADLIMPTLSSAFESTFQLIHRPHPDLRLDRVVEGLRLLRREYQGQLFVEVVLLAGINDTDEEVEALRAVLSQISPERIQLNTVTRPPADKRAVSLDKKRLEDIKTFFGETAEIVAEHSRGGRREAKDDMVSDFLDMVKRRPLTAQDAARALGLSTDKAEDLLKGLLLKGHIKRIEQSGETYYVSGRSDVK
jgi:wyosine [tRNA(Phe)-imidazoG37] synthetase (radical SAM superfamily)